MIRQSRVFLFSLAFLLILSFNLLIQVGVSPGTESMSIDSAVFAYCGQQILSGHLLYRDCWDNKPPAVYYLNALAIAIGGSTPGSIWFFQAAWATLTGLAFFLVLQRIWKSRLVFFITFFFMATWLFPTYYQGGNLTETYVLLPVILMIGMFYEYLSSGKKRFLVSIGVLAALACLLKPTYIAVSLSIGFVVLYLDGCRRQARTMLGHALILVVSLALPLLLVAAYWEIKGSVSDLLFAVFKHNFQYTQAGFTRQSLSQSFQLYFSNTPLAVITQLAFISTAVFLFGQWQILLPFRFNKQEINFQDFTPGQMSEERAQCWHMLSLLLSIPLDFILFALSGKNFGHYLQVPLPALTACCMYALVLLSRFHHAIPVKKRVSIEKSVFTLALVAQLLLYGTWLYKVAGAEIPNPGKLYAFFKNPNVFDHPYTKLEQYILDRSLPSQTVLVWSSDPYLNFVTGRRSPTRYIFPLHLLMPTLTDSNGFNELIAELESNPPAIIAAQQVPASGMPVFGISGEAFCIGCSEDVREGLSRVKSYLESHYYPEREIWDWDLYLRNP
jgi:4-amino-4-deoxy-L-arabinose transferase-like glycosyltransferase